MLDTEAYGLWLANELLHLIYLYNVYISIIICDITITYSILPPYWILFGLLNDIAIICFSSLHITYWMF